MNKQAKIKRQLILVLWNKAKPMNQEEIKQPLKGLSSAGKLLQH